MIQIKLNGQNLSTYGLVPLEGTLDALMKPAQYRALVTNNNMAVNGKSILSSPTARRLESRDVTLTFHAKKGSLSAFQSFVDEFQSLLINGKKVGNVFTGVNEISMPAIEKTYRLVFVSIDKYNNFPDEGSATIAIKFTEPYPNNRSYVTTN